MRALSGLVMATLLVTMLAVPANAELEDTVVYLLPDSSDRYRPAIDENGSIAVVANIDSITAPAVGPDGRIAFSGAIGDESLGRFALFVVASSGSGLTQLTEGNYAEFDPAWSPDGESIAVAQNQTGSLSPTSCCRLAVVDVDSGQLTALTSNVGAARPGYSNNGNYLVFDNPSGVWRISSSGGGANLIAVGGFDATTSPADTNVAYLARHQGTHQIRRVPAGGGSSTLLYSTSNQLESPIWTEGRIYFLEYGGLGYDGRNSVTLRSISQSGGNLRVERSFNTHLVGFSPAQGNDEIFFYRTDGLFRYYQINPDATLPSPMFAGDAYTKGWDSITSVDLDGDGQDEIFFYRGDGLFRYYQIRPDGALPSPSTAGNGYTKNWDAITAVDLDGDGFDEMFFYRSDGLYRYYDIRPDGSLPKPMLAGSNYTTGWDALTAVDLDGDGFDEMFFYRSDGLYRFYDVGAGGKIGQPISAGSDFSGDWTSITAIDLDGDGDDEFFLYRDDGVFAYHQLEPDGDLGAEILGGSGYTSGWSIITSINLGPG